MENWRKVRESINTRERGRGASTEIGENNVRVIDSPPLPSTYFGVRGVLEWGGGTENRTTHLLQQVNDSTHIGCITGTDPNTDSELCRISLRFQEQDVLT